MIFNIDNLLNKDLIALRAAFVRNGYDLRFVGGCVRDLLAGHEAKDIDLCTDATPDEQVVVYQANNIRYIPTGVDHGTVTVLMNDVTYEITSLRLDVATDGRRATVAYAKNFIDYDLLAKFESLGYKSDEEYEIDELIKAFRHINQ